MVVKYALPRRWVIYRAVELVEELTEAKAAVLSLTTVPFQRAWAEKLQQIQLKSEVAGTSRIEGAEFTEKELDAALRDQTSEQLLTRSQRQAKAAMNTYRWISNLPDDRPVDAALIFEVHRRIVTGCDDDHCRPGALRFDGYNVTFGAPMHRGAEGGRDCREAFAGLADALQREFRSHDPLIQALALHYHLGAIHPFQDGNGRTARAMEALFLQRAGLRDTLFIALSNYYYDEKSKYLESLSDCRHDGHDLTVFLKFGLRGIALQCRRLLNEINLQIKKALFRDVMADLFGRLEKKKKRVIAKRQLVVLQTLLDHSPVDIGVLFKEVEHAYRDLKGPYAAYLRDVFNLENLGAVGVNVEDDYGEHVEPRYASVEVHIRLEWPMEITQTEFFRKVAEMPKAKTLEFLQKRGR
jgi:Fic family protein